MYRSPTPDGVWWIHLHIEIQSSRESDFAERMMIYHYRIFDRFRRPVASLAVLADHQPGWRPGDYRQSVLGCHWTLEFPSVKLLDYRLIRLLYGQRREKHRIIQLLRVIDWLMALPPHLEQRLGQRLTAIEGEKHMQYVTSFERLAREEGVQEGVQKGIEKARFKTARNLIAETDMDDATIAELTDLTEDQVRLLRSA